MNAVQEALRREAQERGYSFPVIAFAPLPEPKVMMTRISSKSYNLEIADYMEGLPEELAEAFAVSVLDYITGGRPGIPESVRGYIRETCTERYIARRGFLRPEEVFGGAHLRRVAEALKAAGRIPADLTVLWTEDGTSSFVSPTFRIVAIPTYIMEDRDDAETIGEILANVQILRKRTGAAE